MTSKAAVEEFLAQRVLAVVGASAAGKGFGIEAYRKLKQKGWKVFPVHPTAATIDGDPAYASLAALPEPVGGVVVVVPPKASLGVVDAAADAGISRIWFQQGSSDPAVLKKAEERGVTAIHGECILMFADGGGIHGFHKWVKGIFGGLPR